MAASNINRVILTGNLTFDPELRSLPSGMSVCKLRVAVNTRKKNSASGDWEDKPNYFDVTVWGAQGENCARYLAKGRPVAIDGRLEWSEWADKESGKNRSKVEVVADTVQFLNARSDGDGGGRQPSGGSTSGADFGTPAGGGDLGVPGTSPVQTPADDDIPF